MTGDVLVRVGAVHWQHAAWRGALYPDDLPEDWMLSYYNTQFQAVYLPVAAWQGADSDEWAQWLHDTQPGFVFVLEPSETHTAPRDPRLITATPAWADAHLAWIEGAPDVRALAARIGDHAARQAPLFVFSRGGDIGAMQQVNTLKQVMGY